MRRSNVSILLVTIVLGAVLASAVTGWGQTSFAPSPAPEHAEPQPDQPCAQVIAAMTPRQRLAQLLMVGVNPADPAAATELVRTHQVGGIFLGGSATQLLTGNHLDEVKAASAVPLAVGVDEEGGRVQRIDALDGSIPSARTMAATMSANEVRDLARTRGRALRARGVTVDFAPVVDISGQAEVIGDRSFDEDPAIVTRYALAFAQGLRDAGVLPVVKHFPGHGRASGDSHRGIVTTPPLDELRRLDLRPYEHLLDAGPTAVMLGHVDVPGLTGGEPASLHPAAYQLLRTDYHFDGLTITDDLGAMRAVTLRHPLPEAVLLAITAGADIAFWSSGGQPGPVLDLLEKQLPRSRAEAAIDRVLRAKSAC
jgi:beta-N-acetylhexosaminidase